MAYRAPGAPSVHPADAALSLPAGKHSRGPAAGCPGGRPRLLRGAAAAIGRSAAVRAGKRQVEELAWAAAADVDCFYARARPAPGAAATDVLVLSAEGASIIMRPG